MPVMIRRKGMPQKIVKAILGIPKKDKNLKQYHKRILGYIEQS